MKKYNLPVILLKGVVLLPNNSFKFEFDRNMMSNNVIDMAELFHDDYILIVSQIEELPHIGVLSKIKTKLVLPNGTTRIDIEGIRRVNIIEYMNQNKDKEPLEAIVSEMDKKEVSVEKEELVIHKLYKELKEYIQAVPYISNSVLSMLENIKKLDQFVDIVVPNLEASTERIYSYLIEIDVMKRAEMLLKDIYQEKESFNIEKRLDSKVKKQLDENQKEFILREKIRLIKEELGEVSIKENELEELRKRIENLGASDTVKSRLRSELKRYETIPSASPEINITRDYIEWLLAMPWCISTQDATDLKSVRRELDQSHYGLIEVKDRIIEQLAVMQLTQKMSGSILCLVGPPGVGKTSLAYSIASSMHRQFVKMSVGGVSDEAEIIGHRKTYVGANPGRIISAIKKAKTNNPVFLIDEIDKMTHDFRGDPASSLLSVLDPEQNLHFSDNYLEEEFNLSHVFFILTANYIEDIPEALKDRLEVITLSSYTEFEKLDIAKKHLLPKLVKENGISQSIDISDEVLLTIIRKYTKEAGVRELERQLSKLLRKIVTQIVTNHIAINKIVITNQSIPKYLGRPKYEYNTKLSSQVGVVNGLAYTVYGGDTLPIEVNYFKGRGELILTGSLGDVMKESAMIALNYIKANYKQFSIEYDKLIKNDIHIHVPEGAIKKDGPSAGIALTLALISALINQRVPKNIALTGEITLRGHVLGIGGLKEKSIGALRSGIQKIIIPYENRKDIHDLPPEVKHQITFVPVKNFSEIMKEVFQDGSK